MINVLLAALVCIACIATPVETVESIGIDFRVAYEDKEQPPYYMGWTEEVLPEAPGVVVEMVQMLETKRFRRSASA